MNFNDFIKAQEDFNNEIIAIANKVTAIREYSYARRGLKFDSRNPDKMLSIYEKQDIDALYTQMKAAADAFTKAKNQ
tara:strand:+ start:224 stop:454 length:231 start_codon:yes stop_codon:yes gene_type:complete